MALFVPQYHFTSYTSKVDTGLNWSLWGLRLSREVKFRINCRFVPLLDKVIQKVNKLVKGNDKNENNTNRAAFLLMFRFFRVDA